MKQFKKGDIFFNYGCFPQTWEDPTYVHPDAEGCRGDNDPVDVCEIGARIVGPGVSDASESRILCRIRHTNCTVCFDCTESSTCQSAGHSHDDR
jgi:inorganic pyrophosphatase